ncbi:hypothetical protein IWX47DRAFT_152298 [Phyllosticta citricarpa]
MDLRPLATLPARHEHPTSSVLAARHLGSGDRFRGGLAGGVGGQYRAACCVQWAADIRVAQCVAQHARLGFLDAFESAVAFCRVFGAAAVELHYPPDGRNAMPCAQRPHTSGPSIAPCVHQNLGQHHAPRTAAKHQQQCKPWHHMADHLHTRITACLLDFQYEAGECGKFDEAGSVRWSGVQGMQMEERLEIRGAEMRSK